MESSLDNTTSILFILLLLLGSALFSIIFAVQVNFSLTQNIYLNFSSPLQAGLEKSSFFPVLDRFFNHITDLVLNRTQKNRSIKIRDLSVQFLITVYNSYLSKQFTENFTPYNMLPCLIRLYTHVLHDLGVSSADHTNIRMKRVGPLYTACRVEGLVRLCRFLSTASH